MFLTGLSHPTSQLYSFKTIKSCRAEPRGILARVASGEPVLSLLTPPLQPQPVALPHVPSRRQQLAPSRYLKLTQHLKDIHQRLRASPTPTLLQADFLEQINLEYGRHLISTEAQLQYLAMHLAYFLLPIGQILQLGPDKRYRVEETFVDRITGCSAYRLLPLPVAGRRSTEPAIVVYRGTALGMAADRLLRAGHPTCLASDFDPRFMGYAALDPCSAPAQKLTAWLVAAGKAGQPILLTGFSFGGLLAIGLLSHQSEALQALTQVHAFGTPATDPGTVARLSSQAKINVWRHRRDVLTKAGHALPPHTRLHLARTPAYLHRWNPHSLAFLVAAELDNEQPAAHIYTQAARPSDQWPLLEAARQWIGRLLQQILPD